jgi:hypothetical protein
MATLPSEATPKTDAIQPDQGQLDPQVKAKKVWKELKTQREACKSYRRKLVQMWTTSIDYRRGKPFSSQTDEDRIAVTIDWQLTKSKQALLFSQIAQIRVDHPPDTLQSPWLHAFESKLNDIMVTAGVETAMDEVLPDCINAAGIGVAIVCHEVILEEVQIPAIDVSLLPDQGQSGMLPDGMTPIPMTTMPRVADHRYVISRISPADFLWPIGFSGSNFDNAPWIGRSGRIPWAEALQRFGKSEDRPNGLVEADKDKVCGEDRSTMDKLTHDVDKDKESDDTVSFDEQFYKEFQFDAEAKSFSAIHHVVFVTGKENPVVDEPWKGQQPGPDGKLIGVMRYPIQVLTTTYITDEAIPPSDSAIGRTQVNELNKSRTQMILQRERSLPVRWFDVNRVDPTIQQSLMRGVWQGMIPVQGQGSNIIGEVSRAIMPSENFEFDAVIKGDLMENWQVGQGESGSDIETKGEANVVQNNMQTRIGKERAKVGKFYCALAEILGGLIALYEDPSTFGQGFNPAISTALSYSILSDSTVLLDSNQKIKRLVDFLNFAGKSGQVNIEPILKEIATLSGLDPNSVIKPPDPKPPSEPNISLRLTGTEDMLNPLTLAFLMKSGQAPDQDLIEKAKQLIQTAVTPPPNAMNPPPPPAPVMGPDGQPMDPTTGLPPAEGAPSGAPSPGGAIPIPQPIAPPIPVDLPGPAKTQTGEGHPDWQLMPRLNKRILER